MYAPLTNNFWSIHDFYQCQIIFSSMFNDIHIVLVYQNRRVISAEYIIPPLQKYLYIIILTGFLFFSFPLPFPLWYSVNFNMQF